MKKQMKALYVRFNVDAVNELADKIIGDTDIKRSDVIREALMLGLDMIDTKVNQEKIDFWK